MTGGCVVRAAREEDFERLIEMHGASYPASGSYEQQRRDVMRDPLGGLEARRVVERDGRLVGCGAIYAMEVWLGGRKVPIGGIASVAVAPEARRQGVARALIESMHVEMRDAGAALSLLYPFSEAFYAKLGYGVTSAVLTVRIASRSLLDLRGIAAEARREDLASSTGFTVVAANAPEARALYDEVGPLTAGRIVRGEKRWLERFSNEKRQWLGVATDDRKLAGYASFSYDAGDKHRTLVVHELTARDEDARRALLAAVGAQCDQVETIELTAAYGDPLLLGLHGAAGRLEHGPMVKVIDVRRALGGRTYEGDGELTIACTDDAGAGSVRLAVRSGVADVSEGSGLPDLELSRVTLASIVASGMRPSEAAELGLLRARKATLRVADEIFSGPRFLCLDPF